MTKQNKQLMVKLLKEYKLSLNQDINGRGMEQSEVVARAGMVKIMRDLAPKIATLVKPYATLKVEKEGKNGIIMEIIPNFPSTTRVPIWGSQDHRGLLATLPFRWIKINAFLPRDKYKWKNTSRDQYNFVTITVTCLNSHHKESASYRAIGINPKDLQREIDNHIPQVLSFISNHIKQIERKKF